MSEVNKTAVKSTATSTTKKYKQLKKWEDGYMTFSDFKKYLLEKYKVTTAGKPVSIYYVHYLANQGALPYEWGGNKLEVAMLRSLKLVRISTEIREKKVSTGRPVGSKSPEKENRTFI